MNTTRYHEVRRDLESFSAYLFDGLGYAPTRRNLGLCLQARLIDSQRKTHQPAGLALAAEPEQADGLRQRMNRTVLTSVWDDEVVRERLRKLTFPLATFAVPAPVAWIIDDTGVEKKGVKSPGVGRQYCGSAGKVTNCQLFVSTHLSSWNTSMPLAMDLYLPKAWCTDMARRSEACIPSSRTFATKSQLAIEQVDRLLAEGLPHAAVLADAAYGDSTEFRKALAERGLEYCVAIKGGTKLWRPGEGPDPVAPRTNKPGRPSSRSFPCEFQPVSAEDLARELPDSAYKTVKLTRGRHSPVLVRAAAVRVRTAHRAVSGYPPGEEQWLIVEWKAGAAKPLHYYLSNHPARTRLKRLVDIAKLRWRIERDYQNMKQEVGFSHHEGRRWHGLQHHLTICMAAITFLVTQRGLFPPEAAAVAREHQTRPPA